MKTALLLASCAVAGGAEMTARFANGDVLNGRLHGVGPTTITWDSDSFAEPQALRRDQLVDVLLGGSAAPEFPEGDHIAVVTLTNNQSGQPDQLRGTLRRVTDREIGLLTSYAGELVLRRDMVETLEIQDRPQIHYAGPNSIEEWSQGAEDGWIFERGTLVCQQPSSIGRDMGNHPRFRLSFDLEWRDNARFRLYTCADDLDLDKVRNCFELVCQSQYAYMRKRTERGGRPDPITIGTTGGVREFQEREKVRIDLLHDQVNGRIRFMLGGRVVADWREPAPGGARMGGVVHFMSEPGSQLRISRIQVASWDGVIEGEWHEDGVNFLNEDEPEEEEPASTAEPQGIVLRNGDRLDGTTAGVADGMVRLETPFKNFTLPVSRLRSFALRSREDAADPELRWEPIRRSGDVRASFVDGGSVTFELTGFGDGTIRGRSQTFGEAEFKLTAFNRIEFNLYRRGLPDSPLSDW